MPFIDLTGLNRFLDKVKALIDTKVAAAAPYPWRYKYYPDGDVLGVERDVDTYTATIKALPYKVTNVTDEAKAHNDTTNTEFAIMTTSTTEQTARMYIDTGIPPGAVLSNAVLSVKIGTSNISSAVWTKRDYAVKCGGVTLASGQFALRTAGNIITLNLNSITSPVIEIDITAQTTVEQNVRIFGAEVNATYTHDKEWITWIRQSEIVRI